MAYNENNDEEASKGSSDQRLLEHPGTMASQAVNQRFLRDLDAEVKRQRLYNTAVGEPHPDELTILDMNVPLLEASSDVRTRQWHDKVVHQNQQNGLKRHGIGYKALTDLYALCYESCRKKNPKLAWDMSVRCVYGGTLAGYMNGMLAYQMIEESLSIDKRTRHDKQTYEYLYSLFLACPSPDGALPREYTEEINALLTNILPYVARKPTKEDLNLEVIHHMPKALTEAGRRVEDGARREGRLDETDYVVELCQKEVDYGKRVADTEASATVYLTADQMAEAGKHGLTVTDLRDITKIKFAAPSAARACSAACCNGAPFAFASAGSGELCKICGRNHGGKPCLSDPSYDPEPQEVPFAIAVSKNARENVERLREAEAKKRGVAYRPVRWPPALPPGMRLARAPPRGRKPQVGGVVPRGASMANLGVAGEEEWVDFHDFEDAVLGGAGRNISGAAVLLPQGRGASDYGDGGAGEADPYVDSLLDFGSEEFAARAPMAGSTGYFSRRSRGSLRRPRTGLPAPQYRAIRRSKERTPAARRRAWYGARPRTSRRRARHRARSVV